MTTTNNYDDFNKIISYLNNDYFRILFLDGTTYSASKFYKFSLPFEKGITAEESWAGRSLISIPALLSKGLKEKGKYDKKICILILQVQALIRILYFI